MRCHTAARSSPRGEAAFSRIGGLHPISSHTTRAETCYCTATPTHHAASRFIAARSAVHQSGYTSITSGVTHTVGGLRCTVWRMRRFLLPEMLRLTRCRCDTSGVFAAKNVVAFGGRGGCSRSSSVDPAGNHPFGIGALPVCWNCAVRTRASRKAVTVNRFRPQPASALRQCDGGCASPFR